MVRTNLLKAKFLEYGYTQRDVAKLIGISYPTLNYKLHNKREFNATEIAKISKLCEISDKDKFFYADVDK